MSKKIILVIDDDETTSTLTENILKDDYDVIIVKSGKAALDSFKKKGFIPSLVLLDLYMPGMSGWNTLLKMQKLCKSRKIPIVMYTSSESTEDIEKAKEFGAVGYIHKPSNRFKLLEELAKLLN